MEETYKLTPKHRAFVEAYLRLWNATEAYVSTYPKAARETARKNGSKLLNNIAIQKRIHDHLEDMGEKTDRHLIQFGTKKVRQTASFIYLIGAANGLIKIGKTNDVVGRIKTLNVGSPIDLSLVFCFETPFADDIEESLHAKYLEKRIKGEWFALSEEDIEIIKNGLNL